MSIKLSLIVMIIAVIFLMPMVTANFQQTRVLVVCSDVEDAMLANSLVTTNIDVHILYVGVDSPENREKLGDIWYLRGFDQVWLPDLNLILTSGGKINEKERKTLVEYVSEGHVLVLGLNTYTQHWNKEFDTLFGVKLLRIDSPKEDTKNWDIVYNSEVYPYNDTYQVAVVIPVTAKVIATYINNHPAITLNKFGNGVAVLMTFNPTKELVEYNPEIVNIYRDILFIAQDQIKNRKSPNTLEKVAHVIFKNLENPFYLAILIILVLEMLTYFGLLPLGLTIFLVNLWAPIFSKFMINTKRCRKIYETLSIFKGMTLEQLSIETGIKKWRLKFCLSVLKVLGKVSLIDLSDFEEKTLLITIKGLESDGISAWAALKYPKLLEKIVNNPGITIIDLSRYVNMPPYDILETLKRLSRYGVVELRKIIVDYEVYPTKALMRCFEE